MPDGLIRASAFADTQQSYPVDALGPNLASVVRAIEEATQAPVELVAQHVLAVVSLAVQAHVNVRVPTTEIRPVSCFFLTLAESGERKSAVAGLALAPVRHAEEALTLDAPRAQADYLADLQAWRLNRTWALRDALDDWPHPGYSVEASVATVEARFLARKPLPPAPPFFITSAALLSGLTDQLRASPNLLLAAETPGPFLRSAAKLASAGFLRDIWDNGVFTHGRGRNSLRIHARRLALHICASPGDGRAFLADPVLVREGVLSRFLIAAPASRIGARPWREPSRSPCPRPYFERICALLGPSRGWPADVGEVQTRTKAFSPAACARWTAFAGEMETRLAPGGDFAASRSTGAKLPQQAARLAGLLAAYDDENAPEIAEDHAEGAIALARWYGAEALRLATPAGATRARDRAQEVLDWLRRAHPTGPFALSDVYQDGPAAARSAAAARAFMKTLEAEGHARTVVGTTSRSETWELVQKS